MVALVHCCPAVPMGADDHHHNHVHLAQKIRFVHIKQNTCGQQQEKKDNIVMIVIIIILTTGSDGRGEKWHTHSFTERQTGNANPYNQIQRKI